MGVPEQEPEQARFQAWLRALLFPLLVDLCEVGVRGPA